MKSVIVQDGGPLYAETTSGGSIVEPWNAFSSLVFLIPALVVFFWIKGRFLKFRLLTAAALLLAFGGIGSTVYHAFRSSPLFLAMDVLPIQLLTLLVIIYFWSKVLKKAWQTLLVIGIFCLVKVLLFKVLPSSNASINLSYFLNGVMLFLPILLYLIRTSFEKSLWIFISIFLFALSLFFRRIDLYSTDILPMGTHWLWHVFSAAGSGFLGYYLFSVRKKETGSVEELQAG